jgi:chondroitin 4-sulfotransferase 11
MIIEDNFPWEYIRFNIDSRLLWYNNPKCCSTTIKSIIGNWQTQAGDDQRLKISKIDEYTSFGFVRNPYERIFSAYKMLKALNTIDYSAPKLRNPQPPASNFEDFVKQVVGGHYWNDHIDPQVKYLPVMIDNIKIDFIGKVENFNNDWVALQEIINYKPIKNIKDIPKIQPKSLIKNLNIKVVKAEYESIKKEMSYSTIKKIQEFYRDDFINFGYDIEDFGDFKIT